MAAVAESCYEVTQQPMDIRWLLLAALTLISGSANVRLTAVSATISVSETFVFTSVLLFGASAGTLTVALEAVVLSLWLKHRNPTELHRVLFNIAAPALSIWIAAHIFFLLAGKPPLSSFAGTIRIIDVALPLVAFTIIYFLLNSWLIAFAISLAERVSALGVWRDNLLWLLLNYFGGASVAALLVGSGGTFDVTLLFVIAPILLVLHFTIKTVLGRVEDSNQHLARVNRLYLSTIETLATAIDAKDQVTHGHIRRVQYFATALARHIGIGDDYQIKAIEAAALLHDMGKLAVPDYILNKPGRLTTAEFDKMKRHAGIGADILSSIDFPYPVVPIVRHHHENWDGSGYPDGLKGTEIPIGARILSVVDCFDALTSDRPYRARLPETLALQILLERRGSMYDPLVVDTFTARWQELSREATVIQERGEHRGFAAIAESAIQQSRVVAKEESTSVNVDANSVIAHVLHDATECTAVFFRRNDATDVLEAVDVAGVGAQLFDGTTVSLTDRIVGWVAANKASVHNADSRLDTPAMRSLGTCTAIPVLTGDTAVGVIAVYTYGARRLTSDEISKLESFVTNPSPEKRTYQGGDPR